ncbi:group-specific protein [Virgibacillus kekensis]|uniref:Group-specific protein n=1 Tax=Virgibacillus kekensis TaxID=202261 RepID=A0ABV9DMQ8_9BACI
MKKFYVASSFSNVEKVREVSKRLINKGFIHTYDWTKNEKASSIEELKKIGQLEKNAVMDADFVIVLLPAGKSSHIELGIALGQGKTIFLNSPSVDIRDFETTSTFYQLPEVIKCNGTIDELVDMLTNEN